MDWLRQTATDIFLSQENMSLPCYKSMSTKSLYLEHGSLCMLLKEGYPITFINLEAPFHVINVQDTVESHLLCDRMTLVPLVVIGC